MKYQQGRCNRYQLFLVLSRLVEKEGTEVTDTMEI